MFFVQKNVIFPLFCIIYNFLWQIRGKDAHMAAILAIKSKQHLNYHFPQYKAPISCIKTHIMFNMQKATFLPLGTGIWNTCVGQRMISVLTKRSPNVDQNFNTSRGMFELSESIFTAPKTHFWARELLLLWKKSIKRSNPCGYAWYRGVLRDEFLWPKIFSMWKVWSQGFQTHYLTSLYDS